MEPARLLTHTMHGSTAFHANLPIQPHFVLQPLKCVSHENRRAHHGIERSRRLFSCLTHIQCMEPSCTNKFTGLKPFQKKTLSICPIYTHFMSNIPYSLCVTAVFTASKMCEPRE